MLLNIGDFSCGKNGSHLCSNADFLGQTNCFPELVTSMKQSITGTVSGLRPVAIIKSVQLTSRLET